MYECLGSLVLFPELKILIWFVTSHFLTHCASTVKLVHQILNNKDTSIIHSYSNGPKCALSYKLTLENQNTLIIRTLVVGSEVSIIHGLHCRWCQTSSNLVGQVCCT